MSTTIGRGRLFSGYAAGTIMILSGLVHSALGWPALVTTLSSAQVSAPIAAGLAVPWHFAGLAMVTFGIVAIVELSTAARAHGASLRGVRIIGGAYVAFAVAGAALIKVDPTFLIFLVPGLLLLLASAPGGPPPPLPPTR